MYSDHAQGYSGLLISQIHLFRTLKGGGGVIWGQDGITREPDYYVLEKGTFWCVKNLELIRVAR